MQQTATGVFRICKGCGTEKSIEDFSITYSHGKKRRRWTCRPCTAKKSREAGYVRKCLSKLRNDVLAAYGGACVCCGNVYAPHLTLDHIDGSGAEDRRVSTDDIYARVRRLGYPKDYQLLCFNCNAAKHFLGGRCACQDGVVI